MDNPCQHPIVILRDVAYADLKTVVDYMYKGEINVTHSQLASILRAAETLKVRGLDEMVRTGDARPQSQQGSATLDSPDFEAKDLSRPHKKRKFSIGKNYIFSIFKKKARSIQIFFFLILENVECFPKRVGIKTRDDLFETKNDMR